MYEEPIRVAQIMGKMNSGGVESFIMNYYRNIDKSKIQFDFIVDEDSELPQKEEIENLGGRIIKISSYTNILKYIIQLLKVLKKNDYKIVHSHLNTLSVFPLYCAWKAKVPIRIAHSHSTSNRKEVLKNLVKNILKLFSKVFATNYFACSEHAGRWLFGNKEFDKGNVTIIHNAIDMEKFKFNQNTRNKIRKELNIEDKFVIGHVGRFMKQKNHNFLIDVFYEVYKKNKDTVLILIGEGDLEKDIKEKVNKLNLNNAVYFLGIKENVNEYMQAMDVFAFPSLYEGLGMVVVEAQCIGLRCICSECVPKEVKISNLVEFITLNDLNLWVELLNVKSLIKPAYLENKNNYNIKLECEKLVEKYIEF